MSLEIEAVDVIRLIEQYLKENNLSKSLAALQTETGVTTNTVDNLDKFISDINHGHWDIVLQTLQTLKLPSKNVMEVYEQIVIELIELRELTTARHILRKTEPMELMKKQSVDRYMKLENLLTQTTFQPREAYPDGMNKEKRRAIISKNMAAVVNVVPASRLLTLLGQSLKWQQLQGILPPGTTIDLFRGKASVKDVEEETFPCQLSKAIQFASQVNPTAVCFSPDGQYLVTGSVDGFVEVWNYQTGQLRKDLKFQALNNFMLMETTITSLEFSKDSELLATGCKSGKIKIWRIETGQCVRRFEAAHSDAVNVIKFGKDPGQIFTGSSDCLIRLHGFRSGKTLKEFRGHMSFVNDLLICHDNPQLISASSDGTIKVWSIKTKECVRSYSGNIGGLALDLPVISLTWLPGSSDQFIVCNRSNTFIVMNTQGQVIKSVTSGKKEEGEYLCSTVSPRGNWMYCVGRDHKLYCFSIQSWKLEFTLALHEKDVLQIAHHPNQNLVVSVSMDGTAKIWKP